MGVSPPGSTQSPHLVVSASADDVNILIRKENDIIVLNECIKIYEVASSAKVNWEKSEAFLMGPWQGRVAPSLPGGLRWDREGLKVLGVFLGSGAFKMKNWEGAAEKVCARLSKWK